MDAFPRCSFKSVKKKGSSNLILVEKDLEERNFANVFKPILFNESIHIRNNCINLPFAKSYVIANLYVYDRFTCYY